MLGLDLQATVLVRNDVDGAAVVADQRAGERVDVRGVRDDRVGQRDRPLSMLVRLKMEKSSGWASKRLW